MRNRTRAVAGVFLGVFLFAVIPSLGDLRSQPKNPAHQQMQGETQKKGDVVYVCACMKTKSCSCMTIAKSEGPCACGTKGGPPLKAVPRDSDWAKHNLEELGK